MPNTVEQELKKPMDQLDEVLRGLPDAERMKAYGLLENIASLYEQRLTVLQWPPHEHEALKTQLSR